MASELRFIDGDFAALRWATGCLYAALLVQWRQTILLSQRWVRWGIALWAGYEAFDSLCTSLAVISYKQPALGIASFLTYWSVADDNRVLAPIFDATSSWEIGLGLAAAVFYFFAAVQMLRRLFYTARVLAAALAVCFGLWLYELSKPIYLYSFPLRDHVQDALVYAVTALLAWVVWVGASRGPAGLRT